MSNVKERIIGAVTIMSEEEAEKVWNLIQASFILSDVEEIVLCNFQHEVDSRRYLVIF